MTIKNPDQRVCTYEERLVNAAKNLHIGIPYQHGIQLTPQEYLIAETYAYVIELQLRAISHKCYQHRSIHSAQQHKNSKEYIAVHLELASLLEKQAFSIKNEVLQQASKLINPTLAKIIPFPRRSGHPLIPFPIPDLANQLLSSQKFNFPKRILDTFERLHLTTLGDLVQTSSLKLLAQPNFGTKSLGLVQEILVEYGLSLGLRKPQENRSNNVIKLQQKDPK